MGEVLITQPRDFPAVEQLMQAAELAEAIARLPRPIAVAAVKQAIVDAKKRLADSGKPVPLSTLVTEILDALRRLKRLEITRVINASGILVHTNLGRAPLAESLFDNVKASLVGYSNLEFDLASGVRGSRGVACESYLATLAESESATVVNNCAAALFVILNTLANRKSVLISRGELVQIGGGFRIPEILRRAGARLKEVGTTNITTVKDYEEAIDSTTSLILKVHKSNFVQAGFTEEVPLKALVELGEKHQLPVVNDLGSGVFIDTSPILGYTEPTVQQSVRAGADLTCFSGDKMLGGVQAGLIVGKRDLIARIKKNPIFRTVRVDKVVFSVLERLLTIYLNSSATADIKLWAGLSVPVSERYKQARQMLQELGAPSGLSVEATQSFVGGGALPESAIPSVGLVFAPGYRADDLMQRFRDGDPPIIGRVENDRFILDLAAVDVADLPTIVAAVKVHLAALPIKP
ncbi:MAG: L-seryl-tRNA(Sec) selenium transferase [Candidatus Zixiibacteriota bacterium]